MTETWRLEHLDQIRESRKRWTGLHREQVNESNRRSAAKHHDQRVKFTREWKVLHPDKVHDQLVKWRSEHHNEVVEQMRRWRREHPANVKRSNTKHRGLGFVPLNEPFYGAEGHHLDKERVVYIPAELHKSIPHNVWTGLHMEEINRVALEWVSDNVSKSKVSETC